MRRVAFAWLIFLTVSASGFEREPIEQYRARRARLARDVGGLIVLYGAVPTDLVEFQQEDNFYYLTGFDEPGAILILDGTDGDVGEFLFLPVRDQEQERWDGARLGPGPAAEAETGLGTVRAQSQFDSQFRALALEAETVYTLTEQEVNLDHLKSLAPNVRYVDVAAAIAGLRQVKAETEVALLEKAIEITMKAQEAAAGVIAPAAMEYQVEAAIEYQFRQNGAERPAFPSIVGSGPNSTVLHYNRNDRQMQADDLVVVDIGAEYSGYAADITRTYPVNGRFTPRQREIYQIVLDAQKAALEQVRPGARLGGRDSIHAAARAYIESQGYGEYFIHGTSHYLGLYVHDVGDMSRPLEPNMVLTVEPGIYIPEENIGVRIEDVVVVTEGGYRLLSSFPKDPDDIEALMADLRPERLTD